MRRWLDELKLWWCEFNIAILHERQDRVRDDLAAYYKRRSDLLVAEIELEGAL